MSKRTIVVLICIAVILSACSSPAPSPTPVATQAQAPTATSVPTDTPAPTSTSAPAAQPISAANVAGLAPSGVLAYPRHAGLVLSNAHGGVTGAYTADSKNIVLRTEAGVEVVSAQSLDVVAQYPGLQLVNALADGRFAALQGNTLVKVDPVSGAAETIKTDADFSGVFDLSQSGDRLATATDGKALHLFALAGGAPLDIPRNDSGLPWLRLTSDGAYLLVANHQGNQLDVYDTNGGKKLYSLQNVAPTLGVDSKTFSDQDFNGVNVFDITTGKITSKQPGGFASAPVCDATNACTQTGTYLQDYTVLDNPHDAIAIWQQQDCTKTATESWTKAQCDPSTHSYYQDLVSGAKKFEFKSTISSSDFRGAIGAPDGSSFALFKNSGEIFVYSSKDGTLLAQTDRYLAGSPARFNADGSLIGWTNLTGVHVYDWQNAKAMLEQPQPPMDFQASDLAGVLTDGRLVVSNFWLSGFDQVYRVDVWDGAKGQVTQSLDGMNGCTADAVGRYLLCSALSTGSQRILSLEQPKDIVFASSGPNITVLSPAGDGYATCNTGSGAITYKPIQAQPAKPLKISQPCQPMFFRPDGKALVLQNGVVISLPDGATLLTLTAGPDGKAFENNTPAAFFGKDFTVVDNRVFDTAGKLLVQLPLDSVSGYSLSGDGLTLYALTPAGIEKWQVLK